VKIKGNKKNNERTYPLIFEKKNKNEIYKQNKLKRKIRKSKGKRGENLSKKRN
jgi:hypothetical protein